MMAEDLGIDDVVQTDEHVGIAEEAGDVDEDVAIEGLNLLRIVMKQLHVLAEIGDVVDGHAAEEAATDGGDLVVDEVDLAETLEQAEDVFHETVFSVEGGAGSFQVGGLALNADQFLRDALGSEDVIDDTSADRALGHAVVFGGTGVLGEGEAG